MNEFFTKWTCTKKKQVLNAFNTYKNGLYCRNLYDCYANPSKAKEWYYNQCKEVCVENDGYGLTVLSYNTYVFTVAFIGFRWGEKCFFFITPNHCYYCPLSELEDLPI